MGRTKGIWRTGSPTARLARDKARLRHARSLRRQTAGNAATVSRPAAKPAQHVCFLVFLFGSSYCFFFFFEENPNGREYTSKDPLRTALATLQNALSLQGWRRVVIGVAAIRLAMSDALPGLPDDAVAFAVQFLRSSNVNRRPSAAKTLFWVQSSGFGVCCIVLIYLSAFICG